MFADVAVAVIITAADVGVGCACLGVCLVVIVNFGASVTVVNVDAGLVTSNVFCMDCGIQIQLSSNATSLASSLKMARKFYTSLEEHSV